MPNFLLTGFILILFLSHAITDSSCQFPWQTHRTFFLLLHFTRPVPT